MSSPRDIVTKAVQSIENIRFPVARSVIDRIFRELAEEGYVIVEEVELRRAQECPRNTSTKATTSLS